MADNDTFQHAIPRPRTPMKRESLPRMKGHSKLEEDIIMGKKSARKKSTSKNPPNTPPPHSTPIKNPPNSSKLEQEIRKQRETSVPAVYPDLSEVDNSYLDQSYPSTPGTSSSDNNSLTQTDFSNSPGLNQSSINYTRTSSFNETVSFEIREHVSIQNKVNRSQGKSGNKTQGNNYLVLGLGFLAMAVAILFCFYPTQSESNKAERIFNETEFRLKLTNLRSIFPSQDENIWAHFGSGIADVRSGIHRPAIFLLLASEKKTANCLAKKVAELARYALRGTGDVVLTPDKLENDIGKVLDVIERRMVQTKAVVVTDVLSMQPEALRAFHDVCDQYNPLVAEAVYLFTMNFEAEEESRNLGNFTDEQLEKKFSKDIAIDTLKALITRITSGAVLSVKEEKNIPCSKYEY